MWKAILFLSAAAIAGCASAGTSIPDQTLNQWTAYRHAILAQRDQGRFDAVEAQQNIQGKYEELYGIDPTMRGAFVYGLKLYEAAHLGSLSAVEADHLAQARIDQALAHRRFTLPLYVFPPEASD